MWACTLATSARSRPVTGSTTKPRRGCCVEQAFGAQLEQRLTHRGDTDPQFRGQLVQPNVLPRGVGAVEDPLADIARDVLGKLRPRRRNPGTLIAQIRYSASSRLLMMFFWISLVPSPISRNGASRISRSISYSLE